MSSFHYTPADGIFYSLSKLLRERKWNAAFKWIQKYNEVATMMAGEERLSIVAFGDTYETTSIVTRGDTALYEACYCGAPLRIIELLLQLNPHATKAKDFFGQLPLNQLFLDSPAEPALVQLMLEADPSAAKVQDDDGYLPLHHAAENVNIPLESFEILLAAYPEGAKVPNCFGSNGQLPLHLACESLIGHSCFCQILRSLMQANPAAVSTRDEDGRYPFHNLMERIVDQMNPESLRGFKMVLNANSDIASTPWNGDFPLHYFLNHPPQTENFSDLHVELFDALIEAHPGALIFANDDGQVPLHIAVKNWLYNDGDRYNPPPAGEMPDLYYRLIESLIKSNPIAASIPDNEGRLALHFICMQWPSNKTDRLTVLLAANPDALQHADNEGKNPLQCAFERESDAQEFVACLISAIQKVEGKRYEYTNMAVEGLSVGLVGARKGLEEEREKVKSLEEEIAQLREEIAQLKS